MKATTPLKCNELMVMNLELKLKELGFAESVWGKGPGCYYDGRHKFGIGIGITQGWVYVFRFLPLCKRYHYRRLGQVEASRKLRMILKGTLRAIKRD